MKSLKIAIKFHLKPMSRNLDEGLHAKRQAIS